MNNVTFPLGGIVIGIVIIDKVEKENMIHFPLNFINHEFSQF